jgi:uncharacterized protein YybS (DUF2232 family)
MQRLEILSRFFLALVSTVLLFMIGIGVPPAGVVLLPFVPQPVLSFGLKYGIGWGLGVLLVATVLCAVIGGEEVTFIYAEFALMAGLLFGLLGRLRAIESLVIGITTALCVYTGSLMLYFFGSWPATVHEFRASLTQHLASAARIHEKMGFPQEGLDLLKERTPQIVEMILQLLPALVFISLAFVVLINLLFLLRRFPERRTQWLSVENLREWQGPEFLVWVLIVCGFSLFIPGLEFARVYAFNILLIIGTCYFAQGLAIIAFFFHKNNVPRFLRGVTYVLIIFQQIFTLLVVVLGLFDLWGDFRRLRKNNLTPSQAS